MKYYITWLPNPPDPKYWNWFEIDGLLIPFASLRKKILERAMQMGIHEYVGYHGEIIIDMGDMKLSNNRSQLNVLRVQSWLRADYVTQIDKPLIMSGLSEERKWELLKNTIINARIAREWEKRTGIKVIYVIQGWDVDSYVYCARRLADLGASYFGLGSMIRRPEGETVKIIRRVRDIIGPDAHLHLFGVSSISKLAKVSRYVNSFDSALPIKLATLGIMLDPHDLKRKKLNATTVTECDCPICTLMKKIINIRGIKDIRRINHLRAIHNAYWITYYAHRLI